MSRKRVLSRQMEFPKRFNLYRLQHKWKLFRPENQGLSGQMVFAGGFFPDRFHCWTIDANSQCVSIKTLGFCLGCYKSTKCWPTQASLSFFCLADSLWHLAYCGIGTSFNSSGVNLKMVELVTVAHSTVLDSEM